MGVRVATGRPSNQHSAGIESCDQPAYNLTISRRLGVTISTMLPTTYPRLAEGKEESARTSKEMREFSRKAAISK